MSMEDASERTEGSVTGDDEVNVSGRDSDGETASTATEDTGSSSVGGGMDSDDGAGVDGGGVDFDAENPQILRDAMGVSTSPWSGSFLTRFGTLVWAFQITCSHSTWSISLVQ